MNGEDIVRFARECLNAPFRHQGRSISRGIDCGGVLYHCLNSAGLSPVDTIAYPKKPFDGQLESILSQQKLDRVPILDMVPGDVILMRLVKYPQHLAIYAGLIDGQPYIIHASEDHGKVVIHRICDLWNGRITAVYRMRLSE